MRSLTNAEVVEVAGVLADAFRQEFQLGQLIATAVDLNLAIHIGAGRPLLDAAERVVQLTEGAGTTELLLREVALQRPHKHSVQALVKRYALAPAPMSNIRMLATGSTTEVTEPADRGAYEAIVLEKAGSVKPGAWRYDMMVREGAVCQVLRNGDAVGTGFLVAPDIVMSNWHVFESAKDSNELGPVENYAARFDYRAQEGEKPVSLGQVVDFDAESSYLVRSAKQDLDYVLVRLKRRSGDDALDAKRKRGWLRPASRKFEQYEPLVVLQHPAGRTLEMAIGPVMGWVTDRAAEVYTHFANTEHGSSGSPCFTCKWELAALHHRADPSSGDKKPNRAIAMTAILQDLGMAGTLHLIPELG